MWKHFAIYWWWYLVLRLVKTFVIQVYRKLNVKCSQNNQKSFTDRNTFQWRCKGLQNLQESLRFSQGFCRSKSQIFTDNRLLYELFLKMYFGIPNIKQNSTCSKSAIEIVEKIVKSVQSYNKDPGTALLTSLWCLYC